MSMLVRAVNKEDVKLHWEHRPCVGFMGYINQWADVFEVAGNHVGNFDVYAEEGDDDDWDYEDEEVNEDLNEPIPGFEAENLKSVDWYCNYETQDYRAGSAQLFEELEEILKGRLMQPLSLIRQDDQIIISSEVAGRQMDETLIPLVLLRNALYGSYKEFRDEGFSPYQSVVLCSALYRSRIMGTDKYQTFVQQGDSSLFNHTYSTAKVIAARMLDNGEPMYWQGPWGSNDAGYHSYGNLNDNATRNDMKEVPTPFPKDAGGSARDQEFYGGTHFADLKTCMFVPDAHVFGEENLRSALRHYYTFDTLVACEALYNDIKKEVLNA